jgi:rhamnogalacturonan endolyase
MPLFIDRLPFVSWTARCLFLALACVPAPLRAAHPPPATITESATLITLANGRLTLTLNRASGNLTSLRYRKAGGDVELGNGREGMYFDANASGGYFHPTQGAECRVLSKGPEAVEVALTSKSSRFPFTTEVHYVLPRGASGFYASVAYRHGPGMARAGLGQTRFVIKGPAATRLFTHHVIDSRRKGPIPTARKAEKVQDATYRLADGTVYTKYDNCVYEADHRVHGAAGHGLGLWMIYPSNEFLGGGPLKQNLTVHMDDAMRFHVVLGMLLSGHFGSGGLRFAAGEPWTKVFGPLFVYVNEGTSVDALWTDARRRAAAESAQWPYPWLKHPDYPLQRGTVRGRIRLAGDRSAGGAWAILAPPGESWTQATKGYQFWTRVDATGRFVLEKVRPGRYTLFGSGANQFEDYRRDKVEVRAGKVTDLGELTWKPLTHGRTLWQIGVADRSSGEFKGGEDYRHYGNFLRYPKEFPDDVTFVVGKSKESTDWNFTQWSWYSKRPYWTIRFDLAAAQKGEAMLTLGFASVHPPRGRRSKLQVKVNGKEVGVVRLAKSGTAGYRSGRQDSTYNIVYLPFDAGLLRKGANEITLGHAEAVPFSAPEGKRRRAFGQVMYDAIRLEVAP